MARDGARWPDQATKQLNIAAYRDACVSERFIRRASRCRLMLSDLLVSYRPLAHSYSGAITPSTRQKDHNINIGNT